MNPIIFHPDARDELFSTINYYEEQGLGLGIEFFGEIKRCINLIFHHPKRWKIIKKQVRQYIMQKFPFSIFYICEPNQIYIVAIGHHKRRPFYWKERI